MEKKLFKAEKLADALEKIFILDHFRLWDGKNLDSIAMFTETQVTLKGDGTIVFPTRHGEFEAPVGSWFVKTPDGNCHVCGDGVKFVGFDHVPDYVPTPADKIEIPGSVENRPTTFYYPEDIFETEVVQDGNTYLLRRKTDKNGNLILKPMRKCDCGHLMDEYRCGGLKAPYSGKNEDH